LGTISIIQVGKNVPQVANFIHNKLKTKSVLAVALGVSLIDSLLVASMLSSSLKSKRIDLLRNEVFPMWTQSERVVNPERVFFELNDDHHNELNIWHSGMYVSIYPAPIRQSLEWSLTQSTVTPKSLMPQPLITTNTTDKWMIIKNKYFISVLSIKVGAKIYLIFREFSLILSIRVNRQKYLISRPHLHSAVFWDYKREFSLSFILTKERHQDSALKFVTLCQKVVLFVEVSFPPSFPPYLQE
jgi:hypothetical protein